MVMCIVKFHSERWNGVWRKQNESRKEDCQTEDVGA